MIYAIGKPEGMVRQYVSVETPEEAAQQCMDGEIFIETLMNAPARITNGKLVAVLPTAEEITNSKWIEIRQERNSLLNYYSWTMNAASPLTQECQQEFIDYAKALNRLTVDFTDPDTVVWPTIPTLVYA